MSFYRYDLSGQQDETGQSDARMLYLSTAKYNGDWHSVPHMHPFAELFYVVKGAGQFRIEEELHQVTAGDMVFVNPNVEHTEVSLKSQPLEYIVLGADHLELMLGEEQDSRFYLAHFQGRHEEILMYLRTMNREMEEKMPGYEKVCRDLLDVIVVRLMRQTGVALSPMLTRPGEGRVCAVVQRYIDRHYREAVTLDQLAEIAHVSRYHVVHTFTKEYGISPMNYLVSKRIEESRHLLETTDYPLSRIAHMVGFSSGSYFSQIFRRREGIAPMAYRAAGRNTEKA